MNVVARYTHWLHSQWPAGKVEKLPVVNEDGSTNVTGLYVVGDLTGIPLLKLSANAGTRVVRDIASDKSLTKTTDPQTLDLAIIGGGTSGFAAALEAEKLGLRYMVFEASEPFSTIVNFPKGKPIYKYPTEMALEGDLEFHDKSDIKEGLIEDLREQTIDRGLKWVKARVDKVQRKSGSFELTLPAGAEQPADTPLGDASFVVGQSTIKAQRVLVGIGRSGNYRKLGVPGEDLPKVYNRLHDPADYCGQNILVVGGGDSAMETAIALSLCGADVTLSYRKPEFNRPKPENIEKLEALAAHTEQLPGEVPGEFPGVSIEQASDTRTSTTMMDQWLDKEQPRGKLTLMMSSSVDSISESQVTVKDSEGQIQTLANDSVFAMIGREAPLDFFRKSGVRVLGDRGTKWWATVAAMFLFCFWIYHWKADYNIPFGLADLFNRFFGLPVAWVKDMSDDPSTLFGTLAISMSGRSFYYTLIYASCVVIFGIRRIKRRKTPYVKVQTYTLMGIQVIPLFLLPEIILPLMGHNGLFSSGIGQAFANTFFPEAGYGHGREYWRAYGFILAWPLMAWNFFTHQPLWGWLVLGSLQTFVIIPLMIRYWGKGAYCGWICSCGALAETMGDAHRHKMPHGPFWNRFNMVGQVFLYFAIIIMAFRVLGWVIPGNDFADRSFSYLAEGTGLPIFNYAYMVDLVWAGVIGVAFYFHVSGRVWCRFACPLAALMHLYTRWFSRFAIVPEKKKCISCNVCTSVCHQGIDIMSFANKGKPMIDPECVRCSACVQMCPTGVLSFGQINQNTGDVISQDPKWLAASPVRMAEVHGISVEGKPIEQD